MGSECDSLPVWVKVAVKVVCALGAVGTYYLWHGVFDIATAPSVVGAVVIWSPVEALGESRLGR